MHYLVPEKLNADLSKPALVHSNSLPWTPSQTPGVERRFLERDFGKVTYVRNPPGSTHAPFTKDGCIIFVKLRQMPASTKEALVVRTLDMKGAPTSVAGVTRTTLFESETGETVAVETYAPGAQWLDRATHKGEEFLVLEGGLLYGDYVCEEGTWLRFPPGRALPIRSKTGCKVWVKRDHLAVQ